MHKQNKNNRYKTFFQNTKSVMCIKGCGRDTYSEDQICAVCKVLDRVNRKITQEYNDKAEQENKIQRLNMIKTIGQKNKYNKEHTKRKQTCKYPGCNKYRKIKSYCIEHHYLTQFCTIENKHYLVELNNEDQTIFIKKKINGEIQKEDFIILKYNYDKGGHEIICHIEEKHMKNENNAYTIQQKKQK